MKNELYQQQGHVSVFDSIEHLHISTQNLLSKCEAKQSKQFNRVFQQWERILTYFINEKQNKDLECAEFKEKLCQSKNTELKLRVKLTQKKSKETEMIREIQAIKDHLEEGKEMWARQIQKIEEVMKEQERSKQKIESSYKQRLSEIDAELDDIMHIHKKKLGLSQKLGDILPGLFSQEELQEEKKIALGEISQRKIRDFAVKKNENVSEYDVNSENSLPSMNFEDLEGTQRQVFQRLLELRKKVYKFQHDETTCSESSISENLPSELRSMSLENLTRFNYQALSKTCEVNEKENKSCIMSAYAGIIFGVKGREKYRAGLTNLLKSDKLSISARENIVFDLINAGITGKMPTVKNSDIVKHEDWGDMSSIHGEIKDHEQSQDFDHIFSKASISLSKASINLSKNSIELPMLTKSIQHISELEIGNSKDYEGIFSKASIDLNKNSLDISEIVNFEIEKKVENDISKDAEFSEMSILKDFSKNYSISTRRRLSEESKRDGSITEAEEIVSSRRKFSIEQREPSNSLIIPAKNNLFFVLPEPSARPRSNPRVSLRPEDQPRTKDSSFEEKKSFSSKNNSEISRKPISMLNKLPILPKPPAEVMKISVKKFRGRSLQPLKGKLNQSPLIKKPLQVDNKSTSPTTTIKFRMRRFKEIVPSGSKNGKLFQVPTKPTAAKKSPK